MVLPWNDKDKKSTLVIRISLFTEHYQCLIIHLPGRNLEPSVYRRELVNNMTEDFEPSLTSLSVSLSLVDIILTSLSCGTQIVSLQSFSLFLSFSVLVSSVISGCEVSYFHTKSGSHCQSGFCPWPTKEPSRVEDYRRVRPSESDTTHTTIVNLRVSKTWWLGMSVRFTKWKFTLLSLSVEKVSTFYSTDQTLTSLYQTSTGCTTNGSSSRFVKTDIH